MKFRKKPVIIEAYQTDKEFSITTLEGRMDAKIGDWIITGVEGEQYPCKPDIFAKTYELVGEEPSYRKMDLEDMRKVFNIMRYLRGQFQGMTKKEEESYDIALQWMNEIISEREKSGE